jgi:hypothetical protein
MVTPLIPTNETDGTHQWDFVGIRGSSSVTIILATTMLNQTISSASLQPLPDKLKNALVNHLYMYSETVVYVHTDSLVIWFSYLFPAKNVKLMPDFFWANGDGCSAVSLRRKEQYGTKVRHYIETVYSMNEGYCSHYAVCYARHY